MPFFLLTLLGFFLRRFGIVKKEFFTGANPFVYRIALPASLFMTVAKIDWSQQQYGRFVITTFMLTITSFFIIWGVTELLFRDKSMVGTLVQGGFRSNIALLGISLATSVVGEAAAAPMALAMAVLIPLYSILSLTVLFTRGVNPQKQKPTTILLNIIKTPLVIATLLGIVFSLVQIRLPEVADRTLNYLGGTATPLGMLSIGGMFDRVAATARLRPALYSVSIKVLLQSLVLIPVCWLLGFRGVELFLFFVIFTAPTATSSYAMAVEAGGDGPLAANILIITTLTSGFTLSAGIYLMRMWGWI